jgi:hypothetical protein
VPPSMLWKGDAATGCSGPRSALVEDFHGNRFLG